MTCAIMLQISYLGLQRNRLTGTLPDAWKSWSKVSPAAAAHCKCASVQGLVQGSVHLLTSVDTSMDNSVLQKNVLEVVQVSSRPVLIISDQN